MLISWFETPSELSAQDFFKKGGLPKSCTALIQVRPAPRVGSSTRETHEDGLQRVELPCGDCPAPAGAE